MKVGRVRFSLCEGILGVKSYFSNEIGSSDKTQCKDIKGVWRMPWHSEAMKDVIRCDKPRLGAKNRLTRGFPNGKTHSLVLYPYQQW